MKKILFRGGLLFAVLFTLIFAGCQSAQKLIEKGDDVSGIEKLAKKLTKKPASQEDADLFVSVYPNAVENRLENTETVSDAINGFISSTGTSSLSAALSSVKSTLSDGSFIGDAASVRSAISEATLAYTRAEDLYRIQKAVRPMPLEIGDMSKGEVYWVEKYNDDFAGDYRKASSEMANFIYSIADAGYPGTAVSDKKKDYDLFETVKKYDSNMGKQCGERQARLAYDIGDLLNASGTISDKKSAIDWYKKSDTKVSNYNGVKNKILGTNYEIGELYLAKFESGNTRSDIKDAISYFGYAKDYKDAAIRKAYCESLLDEFDHPVERAEGEELKMEVSMGEVAFSDTMTSATIPIKVSGIDYILTSKDFSITKTSAIDKVAVASTRSSATPATTVTYIATVTPVDPDRFSYGTVSIEVRDKSKKVVESKSYGIDTKKFFVQAEMSVSKIEYSKTDSDVVLSFGTNHLKKKLTMKDLIVNENGTGSTLSEVKLESEYDTTKALYELTFTGVEKGGKISISVLGDDGSLLPCYDHVTSSGAVAKTDITYTIDFKKVYVPPVVEAVAKGIISGESYWCYEGENRALSMMFGETAVISQYGSMVKMSYKIDKTSQTIFFDSTIGRVNDYDLVNRFKGKEFYYETTNTGRIILYEMVYHGDLDFVGTSSNKKFFLSMARDGSDLEYDYDDWTVLPPVPYSLIGNVFYCDECTIDFLSADTVSFNDGEKWNRNLSYKVNKSNRQIEIMDGKRRLLLLEYYIDYGSTFYLTSPTTGAFWTTYNQWRDW